MTGRHVGELLEDNPEVTLAAKPNFLAYLGDGFVGRSQQCLSFGDTETVQVSNEGLSRHLPEEPLEVRLTHPDHRGGIVQADPLRIVLVHELKERP